MRTMKASEFKAKCLQVLDEVQATGEPVQVTKRGRVVAELHAAVAADAANRKESPLDELRRYFPRAGTRSRRTDFDVKDGMDEEWAKWEAKMDRMLAPPDGE